MTEFVINYGLFLAKILTVVGAVLIVVAFVVAMSKKARPAEKLDVKNLNDKYDHLRGVMQSHVMTRKAYKKTAKETRERKKTEKKSTEREKKKNVFVLDFHGDIKASAVANLREEITAILTLASSDDEVVLRLENTGGIVHEHGLAASQLRRLRTAGIPLTVIVDKVAASGGYMMACVADKLLAAPFAVIGSIGVLAQLPNFHEMLKRHGIEFEMQTAGEFKRTITMFGQNTDKEREKLKEQIEDAHRLFKDFISANRPALDLAKVATGEYWYGSRALELGLIDGLQTSDDHLLGLSKDANLYEISFAAKKTLSERLLTSFNSLVERAAWTWRDIAGRQPLP